MGDTEDRLSALEQAMRSVTHIADVCDKMTNAQLDDRAEVARQIAEWLVGRYTVTERLADGRSLYKLRRDSAGNVVYDPPLPDCVIGALNQFIRDYHPDYRAKS